MAGSSTFVECTFTFLETALRLHKLAGTAMILQFECEPPLESCWKFSLPEVRSDRTQSEHSRTDSTQQRLVAGQPGTADELSRVVYSRACLLCSDVPVIRRNTCQTTCQCPELVPERAATSL
eukprot:6205558-Pleurochrysis_carterae.AAC.1